MNRTVRRIGALCAVLVSTVGILSAQEAVADPAYIIDSVEYRIEGRTRQWILEDLLDLDPGTAFPDRESLIAYMARQQQVLVNQRALQDATVVAEYDDGEAAPRPVHVVVTTQDTWNIIVLPYAKYDSNTGLLLSLRGRDYNFFGTLTELEVNFDYERTENNDNLFTISSGFSVPFNMLEHRWRLIMDQSLQLEGSDVDLDIGLGIGHEFEMLGLGWQATYTQRYRYLTNDEFNDGSYTTSRVALDTSMDTTIRLPGFGRLDYSPLLYTETSYRAGEISRERRGVAVGFDQSFDAGGFDWIGNYRNGQSLRLGNDNQYNIDKNEWDTEVNGQVAVYRSLWQPTEDVWPKAGVSAALSGFYLIDGADADQDNAVEAARGILNDTMNGDLGLFANLDAVITVWTLEPIFEAQFGVFFDTAMVRDLRGDFYDSTAFKLERDLRFGSGIEVVGFPLFARSLYVRGSLGFDLRKVAEGMSPLDGDAREIFIGLGHHY